MEKLKGKKNLYQVSASTQESEAILHNSSHLGTGVRFVIAAGGNSKDTVVTVEVQKPSDRRQFNALIEGINAKIITANPIPELHQGKKKRFIPSSE